MLAASAPGIVRARWRIMGRRRSAHPLGLLAVLLVGLAACAGESVPDPGTVSLAEAKPAPAGDAGRPEERDDAGRVCGSSAITVTHACIPSAVRAQKPLTLYAEAAGCYAGSCEGVTRKDTCLATVDGTTIRLDIDVHSCADDRKERSCTSDCRNLGVTCNLPPLAAGTYHVVGVKRPGTIDPEVDRTLTVKDDATVDACTDSTSPDMGK
jgi:hypothetical protein